MKSLTEYINESNLDFDTVEDAAAKVVDKLKKKSKWVNQAKSECRTILKDDPEDFEEKLLNDHSEAPAIWELIVATAKVLKEDPDKLYEEIGLYSFFDAVSSKLFFQH